MSRPKMLGRARWCRGCREWWPAESFYKTGRNRCKACVQEIQGNADAGNKGDTLHLYRMGESLEIIAELMGQKLESVHHQLTRCGVKGLPTVSGWKRNERAKTG